MMFSGAMPLEMWLLDISIVLRLPSRRSHVPANRDAEYEALDLGVRFHY